ncbi:MAG: hypothetical protein R3E79_60205 [Caldilineaceae bacterium]
MPRPTPPTLCLAGAIQVIYQRSRLQQTTAGTGTHVGRWIVGNRNHSLPGRLSGRRCDWRSPTSPVTVAGDTTALQAIAATLDEQKLFNRISP